MRGWQFLAGFQKCRRPSLQDLHIRQGFNTNYSTHQGGSASAPICLIATICFVSLCIALNTVPKLPVPSFSNRVYWLAGLLLGTGWGSGADGRGTRSYSSWTGEDDGDLVSALGCESWLESARLAFLNKREPEGISAKFLATGQVPVRWKGAGSNRYEQRAGLPATASSHETASSTARGWRKHALCIHHS